jgi:CDP-glucose 4,6-dehydratase
MEVDNEVCAFSGCFGHKENTLSNSHWIDRPVLVTGASGLVGGWLVKELLDAGADVVCLMRDFVPQSMLERTGMSKRVKLVHGDLREIATMQRAVKEYEVNTVIHLGAQTIVGIANRDPLFTFESNIQGTWNLLEACRTSPTVKSVVVASSDKAYGAQEMLPYSEDTPLQGEHPYDVSKSCADLISNMYGVTYNMPIAITRCGNFYGGGDLNWSRIVPGTIRSVIRGERPIIRSDGKFVRDYLYVEDGAAAYLAVAEALATRKELYGSAFNFSIERPITVLDLMALILQETGCKLEPIIQDNAPNEIPNQYLSASRAREVLGWRPRFSLEEGLQRTIAWYREFFQSSSRAAS